jgi:adenosine deaminase
MPADDLLSWLNRVPKVELHLHLEGAIPHDAIWDLLQKYGGDPAVATRPALAEKFVYRDFPHFIQVWTWLTGFLREYDDFEFIARQVARDLLRQNIQYAEVFYSPADFLPAGLTPQRITEAIRHGLKDVPEVEVALVADLVRDYGAEQGARILRCVHEVRDLGVIGIGIGGGEHKVPPEAFAAVFEEARRLGFRTSAHAGEAAGPASVWGAVRALRVDRIGHATRAAEDPNLVDHLAATQVPLELCVLSNVRTGVVRDVASHPVRKYFERGIPLSINTDDPSLFGNSLVDEYRLLHTELGFSRGDIERLIDQGIETTWLPAERKRDLLGRFRESRLALAGEQT